MVLGAERSASRRMMRWRPGHTGTRGEEIPKEHVRDSVCHGIGSAGWIDASWMDSTSAEKSLDVASLFVALD